jgi:hypothetical protein
MLLPAVITLATLTCISARRTLLGHASPPTTRDFFWNDSLAATLWTWNSGKKSLQDEAKALFASPHDVIVTCQIEARSAIRDFVTKDWLVAGHAEHWGYTGVSSANAQILSVFVKRPSVNPSSLAAAPISKAVGRRGSPWKSFVGNKGTIIHKNPRRTKPVASVLTRVHATDAKGKGGVSASFTWLDEHAALYASAEFLCAHLDSESNEYRRTGLIDMIMGIRPLLQSDDLIPTILSEVRDHPCSIWAPFGDNISGCPRELGAQLAEDEKRGLSSLRTLGQETSPLPDVVVVFGDLNYRLQLIGPTATSELVASAEGRLELSAGDPLNPSGYAPDKLVDTSIYGFGFTCNQPYGAYLPTYKRVAKRACVELGNLTKSPAHGAETKLKEALIRECYGVVEDEGRESFATKGDYYQLGWLDRFCYHRISHGLKVTLRGDEAWMSTPGKKDKERGSDHLPVLTSIVFSENEPHTSCRCAGQMSHDDGSGKYLAGSINKCSPDSVHRGLEMHEEDTFHCPPGTRVTYEGESWENPTQSVPVQCSPGGKISLKGHTRVGEIVPISKVRCIGYCEKGAWAASAHISKADSSRWSTSVDWEDQLKFTCNRGFRQLGSFEVVCGRDSQFNDGLDPYCAGECPIGELDNLGFHVSRRQYAGDSLRNGMYGEFIRKQESRLSSQIDHRFGTSADRVLEGGSVEAERKCKAECVGVGKATMRCLPLADGQETELVPSPRAFRCACKASLRVTSYEVTPRALADDLDSMKLKIFHGRIASKRDFVANVDTNYSDRVKLTREEFQAGKVMEIKAKPVSTAQLYVAICSRSKLTGRAKRRGTTCRVRAETPIWDCPACNIRDAVQKALQDEFENPGMRREIELVLPLHWTRSEALEGNATAQVKIRMLVGTKGQFEGALVTPRGKDKNIFKEEKDYW